MKAVVIGGTGATGTKLIDELLSDNDFTEVVSLVRTAKRTSIDKLKEVEIDFDKMKFYKNHIQGDIAFSCLGTTLKAAGGKEEQWKVDFDYQYTFAELAKSNGIPTFVLQSAQKADEDSFFFYSKMKGKLEEAVKLLEFEHLVLVQPSILIRPDSDRLGEKIGVKAVQLVNEIGLMKDYKALPVEEVAVAMLKAGKTADKEVTKVDVKEIEELNKK